MKSAAAVNTSVRSQVVERASSSAEISRAGIYTVAIASALIGIWGLACFVGGLVASGGPLSLVANGFKAVAGL